MQDIPVYLDVDIHNLPCEVLDLRFIAHRNRAHTISRFHLKEEGPVEMTEERYIDEVFEAIEKKQGCKIRGSFFKHFAMNSFYITLGNPALVTQIMMQRPSLVFDMSHTVASLLLGETSSHQYYSQ